MVRSCVYGPLGSPPVVGPSPSPVELVVGLLPGSLQVAIPGVLHRQQPPSISGVGVAWSLEGEPKWAPLVFVNPRGLLLGAWLKRGFRACPVHGLLSAVFMLLKWLAGASGIRGSHFCLKPRSSWPSTELTCLRACQDVVVRGPPWSCGLVGQRMTSCTLRWGCHFSTPSSLVIPVRRTVVAPVSFALIHAS